MSTELAPTSHSDLGASAAYRWMRCPGSIEMQRAARLTGVAMKQSYAATEGSVAHHVAEVCLREGLSPDGFHDTVISDVSVDEEMVRGVTLYRDLVLADFREFGEQMFVEQQLSLSIREGMFGTADAIIVSREGDVHVYDFKYGRKPVDAVNNPQLLYYALGACEALAKHDPPIYPANVHVAIVQPRSNSPNAVKRWSCSSLELMEFSADLIDAVNATELRDAPIAAGDWCFYCEAKARCPAQRDLAQQTAKADFADTAAAPPDVSLLSVEEIALVLDRAKVIESWLAGVRAHARQELINGRPIPGYKVVPKRTNRWWLNEINAAEMMMRNGADEEQIYTKKMITPAQAEKKLRTIPTDLIDEHVERRVGEPTLAPLDDPRPAINPGEAAKSDFAAYLPSTNEDDE